MKIKRQSKTDSLYKKNDKEDAKALVKSSFQWFYIVIWILFAFVFLFTAIFRVVSFKVQTNNGIQDVAVIISSGRYSPKTGDKVAAVTGQSNCLGEIMACSGDEISVGVGKSGLADCIIYQNKRYFSEEELKTVFKDMKVPDNCILLKSSMPENEYFRVGEIVEVKNIIGKADCIVYPFDMLGKPVGEIQNI